jgi:hypothetical protein
LGKEANQSLLQEVIQDARTRGANNFKWFVYNVFSACFIQTPTGFVRGKFIEDVCEHLADNTYTMDITGRDHFKSTRLYADIMWRLLSEKDIGFEGWYFSYTHKLAAYHLSKLKKFIQINPFYNDIIDLKPMAGGVLSYTWDDPYKVANPKIMTVNPSGLLSFKRGIHADHIYVDDPFQDESDKKIDPANIVKINNIIKSNLISMVNKGGTCRIVGTPQTEYDFFFDSNMQNLFKYWNVPAITDEPNQQVLWPEWKTFDDLIKLRDVLGIRLFNKEYMALPTSAVDSYIPRDTLIKHSTLEPLPFGHHLELNNEMVVAGFDVGQKVHPSHLAIWLRKPTLNDVNETIIMYKQLFTRWFDNWEYMKQIDFLNTAIEFFNISILRYDNTRAEFMGFAEQGLLSDKMEPVTFTSKSVNVMAANFGTIVETDRAEFINEKRQINQILAVNNELKAVAGPEGHGDAFWSNALALFEEPDRQPNLRWI